MTKEQMQPPERDPSQNNEDELYSSIPAEEIPPFDNLWREHLQYYPQSNEFRIIYEEMREGLSLPAAKLKTPLIVSFIGLPGTGKSTYAKLLQEIIPAVHLPSDVIGLKRLPQSPEYDGKYAKAYVIQEALARYCLEQGYSVIMDDNNRTQYNRQEVVKLGKSYGTNNILFQLETPFSLAVKRVPRRDLQEGRTQELEPIEKVVASLKGFEQQMEMPTPEEIASVQLFRVSDTTKSLEELREDLVNDQQLHELLQY